MSGGASRRYGKRERKDDSDSSSSRVGPSRKRVARARVEEGRSPNKSTKKGASESPRKAADTRHDSSKRDRRNDSSRRDERRDDRSDGRKEGGRRGDRRSGGADRRKRRDSTSSESTSGESDAPTEPEREREKLDRWDEGVADRIQKRLAELCAQLEEVKKTGKAPSNDEWVRGNFVLQGDVGEAKKRASEAATRNVKLVREVAALESERDEARGNEEKTKRDLEALARAHSLLKKEMDEANRGSEEQSRSNVEALNREIARLSEELDEVKKRSEQAAKSSNDTISTLQMELDVYKKKFALCNCEELRRESAAAWGKLEAVQKNLEEANEKMEQLLIPEEVMDEVKKLMQEPLDKIGRFLDGHPSSSSSQKGGEGSPLVVSPAGEEDRDVDTEQPSTTKEGKPEDHDRN